MIGVHTPEFGFEHDLTNVRRAVRAMPIDYRVAIDNDYAVWSAFANHYWPALYFADARGRIRIITSAKANTSSRKWLSSNCWPRRERATRVMSSCRSTPAAGNPGRLGQLEIAETYTGYERTENFASPDGPAGQASRVLCPGAVRLNHWALSGMDDGGTGRHGERARRPDRLRVPRPRS